jgi:hypothetical protein
MLTRDAILSANDNPTQEVEVPEWGGSVTVRGLTGRERDEFEQSMVEVHGKNVSLSLSNARARLVQSGCIDENGKQLFTPGDVRALGNKSGAALERVAGVIQRLSGLSHSDMEELTANFTLDPSGDSISN